MNTFCITFVLRKNFNTKKNMKITIRKRKAKGGTIQLYLDIYTPNDKQNRTNKSLDLYLYENPTPTQKKSNKETMDVAEKIRSKITLELAYNNNGLSDLNPKEKVSIDFVTYFLQQTEMRYDSKNNNSLIDNKSRVYKGGSWADISYWLAPGSRRFLDQDSATATIGFRCAMISAGLNK